jgi:hypothetical protein
MIEANVSPHLSGLRVKGILLSNAGSRMAFVVHVPQGTTAYQANDRRYYGRSEYESKPLPDHEVRLRMFRGKVPSGKIVASRISIDPRHWWSRADIKEDSANKYVIELSFENTGEINITELKARFTYASAFDTRLKPTDVSLKDGWMHSSFPYGPHAVAETPMRVNVYPQDSCVIHTLKFAIPWRVDVKTLGLAIRWTLHLPNTQPIQGSINVAEEYRDEG